MLSAALLTATPAALAEDCAPKSVPSGIQFCELSEGSGKTAEDGQLIRCALAVAPIGMSENAICATQHLVCR